VLGEVITHGEATYERLANAHGETTFSR